MISCQSDYIHANRAIFSSTQIYGASSLLTVMDIDLNE